MATIYTVGDGKTYTTIALAKAAIVAATGGNLNGTGEHRIQVYAKAATGNIYDEFVDTIAGIAGQGASDFISIYAMVNHKGLAGGGITLTYALDRTCYLGHYTILSGFNITGNRAIHIHGKGVVVDKCVIHDISESGTQAYGIFAALSSAGVPCRVRNTMIFNVSADDDEAYGIWGQDGQLLLYFQNCTIWNIKSLNAGKVGYGAYNGATLEGLPQGLVGVNTYIGDCKDECYKTTCFIPPHCGKMELTYCFSDDDTADDFGGAGNQILLPGADQFINVVPGSENLHLRAGADCLNAGTTVAGYDWDIDGDHRPQYIIWDVGADEKRCHVGSYATQGVWPGSAGYIEGSVPQDYLDMISFAIFLIAEEDDADWRVAVSLYAASHGQAENHTVINIVREPAPTASYIYALDITELGQYLVAGNIFGLQVTSHVTNNAFVDLLGVRMRYRIRYAQQGGLAYENEQFYTCQTL